MSHSRRRVLRGSAVALSGAAAGALVTSGTDTARAAETTLSVEGDEATVRGGGLAALTLDVTTEWSYAVPSGEHPATVVVEILAGTGADDMEIADSTEREEVFLEAHGEEAFSVDLLDADAFSASELVPSEPEATRETTVHVGAEMRLRDESDLVIAADSQTDTATVSIEKSEYDADDHGEVSGSGELTVELA